MPHEARSAVLPSPVTFHAMPARGAQVKYGNVKYVPSFRPSMPPVLMPLSWEPEPGTMLPLNAVGKKTFGLAGSIVRWLAAGHVWFPGTPLVHTSRYTRAAWLRCH